MALSRINASAATLTKNRTEGSVVPVSGMCVTCVDGCIGMCEIGKSAYRGHEVIYPQPFGVITTASEKQYPVDYSHFNIMGTAVGAYGIEPDSDKAIFPAVNLEVTIGHDKGIKFRYPWLISGIGSTDIAKNNWEGLAIGSALSGTGLTIGENVVGMDPEAVIKEGRVVDTVELKRRVRLYKDYQHDGYGAIIVQANIEDTRLGTHEYAIEKLGVECIELKWGQGAKDIGGEVKVKDLKKAQMLHKRGYIVLPDPTDPDVIKAFERKAFKEFERHSRVGMVSEESFAERVEALRKAGAKYIFLKTGAYRPADLARAIAYASKYRLDLLTVDAAGGGTGMSPWRMMNGEFHQLNSTLFSTNMLPISTRIKNMCLRLLSEVDSFLKTVSSRPLPWELLLSNWSEWQGLRWLRPWWERRLEGPLRTIRFQFISNDSVRQKTKFL